MKVQLRQHTHQSPEQTYLNLANGVENEFDLWGVGV